MIIKIIILIIDCSLLIFLVKMAMTQTDRITSSSDRTIKKIIINGLEYGLIFWLLFMGVVFVVGIVDTKYIWTLSNLIVTMGILVIPSIFVALGVCWKLGIQNIYVHYLRKIINNQINKK
jgi:ABC-type Fe3+ transport system permease subunit